MREFEKGDDLAVNIAGLKYPLYGQFISKTNDGKYLVQVFNDGRSKTIEVSPEIVKRWRGGTPPH